MAKKRRKTRLEKMMISLTITTIFCVFVSVFFFKAKLSSVNIEVEKLKKSVSKQEKINESLTMKVNELTSFENIKKVIDEQGLAYNNENIIVVK